MTEVTASRSIASLVIPSYQESLRLPAFLPSLCEQISRRGIPVRILAVDDGSGKAEAEALSDLVAGLRVQFAGILDTPLFLPENVGKGGAIRAGWREAVRRGDPDYLAFVDADGSVPPEEVCRLIESASKENEWDAWFGSRIKMLGKSVDRLASRHLTGRIFATLVTKVVGIAPYDSQCGLKVLRTAAFRAIEPDLEETGFAFDVELCLLLLKKGFRVCERPISWREIAGSKVRIVRDSIRMFLALYEIRQRHGSYAGTQPPTA